VTSSLQVIDGKIIGSGEEEVRKISECGNMVFPHGCIL
jgi:hypothetical protein